MSVNPEDWDVDFAFPDFNLALFEWERSWCRNWIVTFPGRKYGPCLEILTQITLEDKKELAEIQEFFPKNLTSESFDNDNKLTLKSFFAFCSVFLTRTNGGKMETTSRKTQCPVSKILQRFIKELKITSALSFDQINFFHIANLFSLSRKPFVVCYCFREAMKTFFLMARALCAWAINQWKKLGP